MVSDRRSKLLATGIYALALLLIAPGIATAQPKAKERVITIEGKAAGADRNAMEQAKQDALRRAVEQACGTFISSQTKTKDYAATYDKCMSFAGGYVTEFDIVSQRVEDGMSICKVRATVSTAAFEAEWARLCHTVEAENNPRCIVIIVEDSNADDGEKGQGGGIVQSIVESFFLNKGVQLMDKEGAEGVRERDLSLAAFNDDAKKLAAIGAAFKADVVIRGVADARHAGSSQVAGRTVNKWSATISIRAYHTDSAQLIMSNSYTTTKSSVNNSSSGDDALRACAEQNSAKMLRDIGEAWRKRQNIRRISRLVLENCSRPDYKAFETALRKVDGVQEVRLRELVNNVCQVEVDWAYDMERLAGRIEELKVDGATYEITEQSHDRITVKVVK